MMHFTGKVRPWWCLILPCLSGSLWDVVSFLRVEVKPPQVTIELLFGGRGGHLGFGGLLAGRLPRAIFGPQVGLVSSSLSLNTHNTLSP